MRILVVDDVPVVRMVIAKALKREGHAVSEASDGSEAMALLRDGRTVDVLVTDIWMRGLDGLDLVALTRQQWPHLAIVAMSGGNPRSGMVDTLEKARMAGAHVTIMKPVDRKELLDAVNRAMAQKEEEAK